MTNSVLARIPVPARLGALLGAALLAAACGSSGNTPAAASTATGSATALVITTKSWSGGMYLTDGSGRAVYLWTKDGMDKSECSGACASAWPPVTATGTVTASGSAVAKDLGTISGSDGGKQVTYNGHPLYYYVGDVGPGQTTGQGNDGFGAKWWLVSPAGASIITAGSQTPSSSSPSSSSGY